MFAAEPGYPTAPASEASIARNEIDSLRHLLVDQQRQIDELRGLLLKQQKAQGEPTRESGTEPAGTTAGVAWPARTPVTGVETALAFSAPSQQAQPSAIAVSSSDLTRRVDQVENAIKGLGGFQLSGDFRYRFDAQLRSGNDVAAPLQNIRNRYRLRMNIDKNLANAFKVHMQISTGPYANQITNDQDFGGFGVKAPFSLAEAWVNYAPNQHLSFRAGRMEETFSDNSRFLWDDDVRFNGFEEIFRTPLKGGKGIFNALEFRAGEYILTNPNVAILPANSPFVSAGYQVGTRVGAANLFHPGVSLNGSLTETWSHRFTADVQVYRNPNQIALGSTASGFPVVANNTIGLVLSAPLGGAGNATISPGGAIYSASDFQIARLAYRLDGKSMLTFRGKPVPGYLDFQVSRNAGANKLRDAMMATANIGAVRKAGDIRLLYQFSIKDANSLISQFTDDDLGTGSGVNIAVHAARIDIGITRFLQFQNLFFVQNEKSITNAQELFFVPLQRGAHTTYRYLGQLAFTF